MTSSTPYLESGDTCGPTSKHVLYVEVLPSAAFNLQSDGSSSNEHNTEDPLNLVTKCKTEHSKTLHGKKLWKKYVQKDGELRENDKRQLKQLKVENKIHENDQQNTLYRNDYSNCEISSTSCNTSKIGSRKRQKQSVRLKQSRIETKQKKFNIKQENINAIECGDDFKLPNHLLTSEFVKLNQDCDLSDDSNDAKHSVSNISNVCQSNEAKIGTQNCGTLSINSDENARNLNDSQNGEKYTHNGVKDSKNLITNHAQNGGNSSPQHGDTANNSNLESQRCNKKQSLYCCNLSMDCKYVASQLRELNRHKKEFHKDVRQFQCHECLYRGATAADLRKHFRQHSGELPYVCRVPECDFKAKHNNSLVYHTKKYHPSGEPMQCPVESCTYSSHLPGNMRLHALIKHSSGKSLCCELCSYKCYLMGDLRKHQRVHSGDSPFRCSRCPYRCKISSNLKKHFRTHTMEQPFQCEFCEFRTNFVNSLKVHRRTHSNERPYSCTHCSYRCNHASNLKKHIQRLHPGSIHSANVSKHTKELR